MDFIRSGRGRRLAGGGAGCAAGRRHSGRRRSSRLRLERRLRRRLISVVRRHAAGDAHRRRRQAGHPAAAGGAHRQPRAGQHRDRLRHRRRSQDGRRHSYDDYPAQAKALPKIGDFTNPSVEKIASFKPDLVLAAGGVQAGLRSKLEALGMQVFVVDPTTYDGVMADIGKLGQLTGTSSQAAQVVQNDEADRRTRCRPRSARSPKPTTFLEIYSKPLMTAGSGTFIDDMITIAGGTNIGAAAGSGFPNFSSEVLLQGRPGRVHRPLGAMARRARSPNGPA